MTRASNLFTWAVIKMVLERLAVLVHEEIRLSRFPVSACDSELSTPKWIFRLCTMLKFLKIRWTSNKTRGFLSAAACRFCLKALTFSIFKTEVELRSIPYVQSTNHLYVHEFIWMVWTWSHLWNCKPQKIEVIKKAPACSGNHCFSTIFSCDETMQLGEYFSLINFTLCYRMFLYLEKFKIHSWMKRNESLNMHLKFLLLSNSAVIQFLEGKNNHCLIKK